MIADETRRESGATVVPLRRTSASRESMSDESLARDCVGGDPAAIAALFDRHGRTVSRFVFRMIHDENEVEDIVQATFVEVLRGYATFDGRSMVSTWLLGIAANVVRHQDWRAVSASLVQCIFPNPPIKDTVTMIAAATGYDITLENVLSYGERMWDLKRALNLKLGYQARASERMPELLLRALSDSGTEGHVPELEPMLREYYTAREWDWETGKPRREKLVALGMPEIAADLWGEKEN